MTKLFWKARYALILARRSGLRLSHAWGCAEAGWEAGEFCDLTPSEAVDEELSCWSE